MALDDVYGLRYQFRSHGRVWSVNLHYRDTTGVDEVDASNDLIIAANTLLGPKFDAMRASDSTREGSYCWNITQGKALPDKKTEASIPGTQMAPSLPPNMCNVFTKRTTDPEATRFGRIYMASLPSAWIVDGVWSTIGWDTASNTLIAALADQVVGSLGTWQPVVLRRVSGGIPLVPPESSDISTVSKTNVVYSQRRRNSRQIGAAA